MQELTIQIQSMDMIIEELAWIPWGHLSGPVRLVQPFLLLYESHPSWWQLSQKPLTTYSCMFNCWMARSAHIIGFKKSAKKVDQKHGVFDPQFFHGVYGFLTVVSRTSHALFTHFSRTWFLRVFLIPVNFLIWLQWVLGTARTYNQTSGQNL